MLPQDSFSQQLNNIAKAYTGTESKEMINESVLLIEELQKEQEELQEKTDNKEEPAEDLKKKQDE